MQEHIFIFRENEDGFTIDMGDVSNVSVKNSGVPSDLPQNSKEYKELVMRAMGILWEKINANSKTEKSS